MKNEDWGFGVLAPILSALLLLLLCVILPSLFENEAPVWLYA
jgi:hypothetical protein